MSLSPYTELRIGFGFPRTGELLAGGVTVGLSVDTTVLSGNADMFAIMKAIQNVENSRTESEFKLPPRRVLELATIEGARSMGVDDRVGSLKPGKRADVIMVSTRDVNIGCSRTRRTCSWRPPCRRTLSTRRPPRSPPQARQLVVIAVLTPHNRAAALCAVTTPPHAGVLRAGAITAQDGGDGSGTRREIEQPVDHGARVVRVGGCRRPCR